MREIKFRAWDFTENKMMETTELSYGVQYNKNKIEIISQKDCFIFMQYTGLKDKQGIEIYEGDILVAKNKKDSKNNDWIGIVEDNNFGWLGLKYKEYINPSWLGALSTPINEPQEASWIVSNCEVVGNIYENKELLK